VIKKAFNRILNNEVLFKSILTMIIQLTGQASAFLTAIVLARYLSIKEYGFYIFGVTLATILAVIATFGAGGILARSWGWSDNQGEARNNEVFHIHTWYQKRGIILILTVILAIAIYTISSENTDNIIEVFALCFAIPYFIANLLQSFFVAIKKVIYSNLIQLFMRLIMLIVAVYFFVFSIKKPTILVFITFILMLIYMLILWSKQAFKYKLKTKKPQGSNLSFAFMQWGILLLSYIDILLLQIMSTADNIALFGVAIQLSGLVTFVLSAVNLNILSQVADDYKNLSLKIFQKRITSFTKVIFLLSSLVLLGLIFMGYFIVLLYGEKYISSYYIFCILIVGQAFNVFTGAVATILNMAGFEKITCKAFYLALCLNILMGIILLPIWGVYGLAIASALSTIYWNLHLLIEVIRKVKINPTIFAVFKS